MRAFTLFSRTIFILWSILLCLVLGCERAPDAPPHTPAAAKEKARVEEKLKPEEQERLQRLNAQASSLQALAGRMKGMVDALKDRERSEKTFVQRTKRLSPVALKALLKEAEVASKSAAKTKELREEAKAIDAGLKTLLKEVRLNDEAHVQLKRAKRKIDELQRSVKQLAPGANAAFRAHALLIKSELALDILDKR